ncbi:zinc finger BED domain-containing protein 4-like [Cyprinodon tularosa]|uniref:zinc finger BED domain-containing protein 4-like n=1 Tax=Cyprinodon tularosa TaxID=77115 RepID=UPI0018E1DC2E|nr:zinc finger BED domain-containing protein 4-like [Cyprinodon tularosa]
MQAISTVESPAFRRLVSMIPGATRQMGRKTFSKYLEREYAKMESELKKTFEGLNYISTTADIWSAHNRSFMGITSHWINPTTLQRQKAALACKRIKGRHTYDLIAGEIDHIHSLYGVSTKVTSTVTDNGSNFVKAFAMYQPESFSDDDDEDHDDDDDVTFTDVAEVLNTAAEEGIVLPPHQRCASHTLNLISCSDVEKWLVSNPGTKALYRSSVAKCTALWNKANRSTLAAEVVSDVVNKKLLVPCTTRWNSFYEAVARIVEIPMTDLSAIADRLQLKSISDRELNFLKEYCVTMKPLTVALDILQGEENCYFGTLLPTLETLMSKILEVKDSLTVATGLPEAIVQAIKRRFASVLESNDAMLAAVTLPKFKLRWVRDQRKKEMIKGILIAECHKFFPDPEQQPAGNPVFPTTPPDSGSSKDKEQDFFSFEDSDENFVTVETEVMSYLKTTETGMDILKQFPTVKEICLKLNAATPSSAPVERLFSLGSLVLSPKRNRLSDQKFEKLLLMRYNQWFED